MAADNGQSSFRRGVMSLVILSLLKREDMYGYQLVHETERKSGGQLTTQEGSLYPVLYKLLDQGLISDRKVLVGKRMTRVYYHLEPAGEKRLAELVQEYEEVTMGVLSIVREEDDLAAKDVHSMVSVADPLEDAMHWEAEGSDPVQNGSLHPGLCF